MTFHPDERLALFIDGANLHKTTRSLGFDIDFKRLLEEFRSRSRLVRAYYYTALRDDQEYNALRPLVDFLSYNGFSLVTKTVKRYADEATGAVRLKGNMDIEIAVDMLQLAPRLDHVVLFSGDGDFRRLVEAVQRMGVRVTVVSSLEAQPPMVSDDLRRQADRFIDLVDLEPDISRPRPAYAAQRYADPRGGRAYDAQPREADPRDAPDDDDLEDGEDAR